MLHDLVNKIIHIRVDIIGDSESDKPLDVPVNSTYYEVDTMNFYIFYGGEWVLQAVVEEADSDDSEDDPPAEENNSKNEELKKEVIPEPEPEIEE